jgi:phosphotransferase system HPr (HPr) family protein
MNTLSTPRRAPAEWRAAEGPLLRQTFVVTLEHGMHARPCAALVKALQPFEAQIDVEANGQRANGQSVLGLMALAAGHGARMTFAIGGADASRAMEAVRALFDTHFGEVRARAAGTGP